MMKCDKKRFISWTRTHKSEQILSKNSILLYQK